MNEAVESENEGKNERKNETRKEKRELRKEKRISLILYSQICGKSVMLV